MNFISRDKEDEEEKRQGESIIHARKHDEIDGVKKEKEWIFLLTKKKIRMKKIFEIHWKGNDNWKFFVLKLIELFFVLWNDNMLIHKPKFELFCNKSKLGQL